MTPRKLNFSDSAEGGRGGLKMTAPAAARNLAPIQEVLAGFLPAAGRVLELASGTGEHIVAHARAFPDLDWQPSEPDPERRVSIDAYVADANLPNLHRPLNINVTEPGWARTYGPAEVVLVVNLLHLISDAEFSVLLDEAAQALAPAGVFAIYGPFLRDGQPTSEGDMAFHISLQGQDPAIGYKDLDVIASVLEALQLRVTIHQMPANNLMVVARRPAF
jgi:SAM-dependent methyltransferase